MDTVTRRRNRRTMIALFSVVAVMVGLAFASVPLYNLFCRVTGYGGTPGVVQAPALFEGNRRITVRFDAGVNSALPWRFAPAQGPMTVRVGETALAFFRAQNIAAGPTVGTATYNVTPLKAGKYLDKIDCFCFTEQRLEAGETVDMAVSFFVDPAILEDRTLDDVKTITLSYTFFPQPGTEAGAVTASAVRPAGGTVR